MKKIQILSLCLLPLIFSAQKVRVFVLAGQSNMNGFGYNKDLPNDLKEIKTYIFFREIQLPMEIKKEA